MQRFLSTWLMCLLMFLTEGHALFARGTDNPNIYLGTADLALRYGYPIESHTVETKDGYIIDIFRIRHGKKEKHSSGTRKPVVLLHHAYQVNSDTWLILGEGSLPFQLADAGYDVWLGNQRGDNKYGVRHRTLDVKKEEFWDFSWDQVALIDMPTIIDYILDHTSVPSLTYLGPSLGGAIGAAMLSQYPEFNEKVNLFVGLAPAMYVHRATTPERVLYENYKPIEIFRKLQAKFNPLATNTAAIAVRVKFCSISLGTQRLCKLFLLAASGFDPFQMKKSFMPNIYSHFPILTGDRFVGQLGQNVRTGEFKRYDFGPIKNLEVYKSIKPPMYPLENVQTKVALFTSRNDWLVNFLDVKQAASEMPNVVKFYFIPYRLWGHYDHLFGKDAKTLVYPEIVRTIQEFAPKPRNYYRN